MPKLALTLDFHSIPFNSIQFKHEHTIHSIAFKPADSGWGAGKTYASNFDNIFGKAKQHGNDSDSSGGEVGATTTTTTILENDEKKSP